MEFDNEQDEIEFNRIKQEYAYRPELLENLTDTTSNFLTRKPPSPLHLRIQCTAPESAATTTRPVRSNRS